MDKQGGATTNDPVQRAQSDLLPGSEQPAVGDAQLRDVLGDLHIGIEQLFVQTSEQIRMALCISDPAQDDCPIVYCNKAFTDLTGYSREEIVGRNCRFLQGRGTRPEPVRRLREAIEAQEYIAVDILNYRKDGSAFWNAVHVSLIYDEHGKLMYYFGSQLDITELLAARETIIENERVAEELQHRTNNLFAVLSAIVRLSSRNVTDVEEMAAKIERRIEALASAHRISLTDEGPGTDRGNLRSLVEAVMRPYDSSNIERIELVGDTLELPRRHVTPMGLTLHELATNALKYGALASSDGKVHIDWEVEGEEVVVHWIEYPGEGHSVEIAGDDGQTHGSGSRLIDGVIRGIGGEVTTTFAPEGLRATIRIPVAEELPG